MADDDKTGTDGEAEATAETAQAEDSAGSKKKPKPVSPKGKSAKKKPVSTESNDSVASAGQEELSPTNADAARSTETTTDTAQDTLSLEQGDDAKDASNSGHPENDDEGSTGSSEKESEPTAGPSMGERIDSAEQAARAEHRSTSSFAPFFRRFRPLSALPRLNVAEAQEKYAYIAALLVGVIIIGVGKGFQILTPWLAVIIAAVIIIAYALFAWTKRDQRVRLDRSGDNCYYLGLTYTLVSMFVALIQLEPGIAPDQLIGAFGIALGSTIVGIIARLILIQFRTEIDDVEAKSRLDLAEASDRLRGQLDHASSRFQTFAIGIQEAVRSSVVDITDNQLGRQRELIEEFSGLLEASVTALANATSGMEASLARHTDIAERFDQASSRSVEAAQALAEKVERVQIPDDLLTKGFADVAKELNQANEALKGALKEIESVTSAVGSASDNLVGFAENSKTALNAFDGFTTAASDVATSMTTLVTSIDKGAEKFGEGNTKLDAELARMKELSLTYAASLADVANFLAKEIGSHGVQRR